MGPQEAAKLSSDPAGPDQTAGAVEVVRSFEQRATAGIAQRQATVDALQRELKELKAISQLSQAMLEALNAGLPATALHAMQRAKDARRALQRRGGDSAQQLEQVQATLQRQVDDMLDDIARAFPAQLEARQITLDPSSRDPKFTIDRAFIEIFFDKRKRVAILQTRGGRRERLAPDPGPVADRVATERARLFEREINLSVFAAKLRDAYRAVAPAPGASVPIPELLARLRQADKHLATDEFTVDLARLVASRSDTAEAAGMRLEQTRREDQGLLVPGMERHGYFGYVTFDERGAAHGA